MPSKERGVTRTIYTRSASTSAGHPVGFEAPAAFPPNFGPRTIQSLPANFLVDPDSIRRRGRQGRQFSYFPPCSCSALTHKTAREAFSEGRSETTVPDDPPSPPPTPRCSELSIATIPIPTEPRGSASQQTVRINPVVSAHRSLSHIPFHPFLHSLRSSLSPVPSVRA